MTDARFPERWLSDRRLLRLADPDFRVFVTTLAWSVSNRTDGVIEHDDLALVVGADQRSAAALVAAGLWAEDTGRWTIVDFDATQTSAHQLQALDNVRKYDRDRKARRRRSSSGPETDPPPTVHPLREDVRTENIGQDRLVTGQASDRTGFISENPQNASNNAEGVRDDPSPSPRRPLSVVPAPLERQPYDDLIDRMYDREA